MMIGRKKPPQNLCTTFKSLSRKVWRDIRFGAQLDLSLSEESITDYFLLDLKRRHPGQVKIIKFSKNKEGKVTGADWEWWFGSRARWYGMRVQAKKLEVSTQTYAHLSHKVGKNQQPQVDLLINDARKRGLHPIYCFYNYWPVNMGSLIDCSEIGKSQLLWGCTIADGYMVRRNINANQISRDEIIPISLPLSCLVCCPNADQSLAQQTLSISRYLFSLSATQDIFPSELRSELPAYVQNLIDGEGLSNQQAESLRSLDGILVIEE